MRTRLITELVGLGPRRPCSDAERRAARLLARELRGLGRRPRTETFWVRPQWPAIWLLHAVLGIAVSIASLDVPAVALGVAAFTALSALGELTGRLPVLSLLWPRRASQNVVSESPDRGEVRLLVTAPYDAPRAGTPLARPLSDVDAWIRGLARGWWPHPLAWIALSLVVLAGCAGARLGGIETTALGAVQLAPTVVCIVAVAVLLELGFASPTRGANAHASSAAVALALVESLDERPPRRVAVDVLFAGAGAGPALGMRTHVRGRRKTMRPEEIAVLHLEPCGAGAPVAWRRGGPLLTLAFHPQLVRLADATRVGPEATGAVVARRRRWPAIALGCLDERGRAPERLDPDALEGAVQAARRLVAALDDELAGRSS